MRVRRRSIRRQVATALALVCLSLPCAADDLYREAVCLGYPGDASADPGTTLVKLLRWPHALEQPFHMLAGNPLDEAREPDAASRLLFYGHSGLILEGPSASPWDTDIELQTGFARGPLPGRTLCESGVGLALPKSRITTDPYTGNLFAGRLDDERLHLAIFNRSGELLAEVRSDLFFRSALPDLSDTAHAAIDLENQPEFFWFDAQRLAGFVDVYRRIGGAAYARFLVDAFLSELIYRDRTGDDESAGPRLPFLPGPDSDSLERLPEEVDNLRGLRTTYRQVFIRGKPGKGGVSCALMPVLKMLEDRDCRVGSERATAAPPARNSCPTYSAMALQTELFRAYPETIRHRGYALHQVFETLVEQGVCSEGLYPMLADVAMGRSKTVDQFGARAEQELNRILSSRGSESSEKFGPFLERTPAGPLQFEEQLPPLCREEMAGYSETHPLAPHDLVDLLTTQEWFGDARSKEVTAELVRAQKDELYRLVVRLLGDGLLVGVAGDRGALEQHAVLAYGWNEEGFLLMDSDLPTAAARRRTLIPAGELRRSLKDVTYLRDEVPRVRPTAPQLVASLRILPKVAWTHVRIAELYREQGRQRDALVHLRRAVDLVPARASVWLDLGEVLQLLGRFEEAAEATRTAIEAGADGSYTQAQLGYSLRKLGRLEEAEQALRASVNAEHSWEWRQLGWTLFDRNHDDEAESCFRKAVEIEPQRISNHVQLAEFLAYSGRPEAAREALLAGARGEPDPSQRTWIGSWLGFLGFFEDAIPLLETVLAEEPQSNAARLALARIHRRQGELGKAASTVAPLIAGNGQGLGERIDVAYAQAISGDATACRTTVVALKAQFEDLEGAALYDLACIQALNGDLDQALDSLESAFQRGFDDYRWARRDPDLAPLSGTPRLDRIFASYGPHER